MSIIHSAYSYIMFGSLHRHSKQSINKYTKVRRKNQLAKISRRKNRYK